MSARGDIGKLRLVLRAGATVFGLSAVLLVFLPRFFTDLLGLQGSVELDWSMQMIGLTLVALTGNMLVVSLYGSDAGVLLSARVMQIAAFGLGVIAEKDKTIRKTPTTSATSGGRKTKTARFRTGVDLGT